MTGLGHDAPTVIITNDRTRKRLTNRLAQLRQLDRLIRQPARQAPLSEPPPLHIIARRRNDR